MWVPVAVRRVANCYTPFTLLYLLYFTISCFSKIQIGFTFLVPAHPSSPGKRAVIRVCARNLHSKLFRKLTQTSLHIWWSYHVCCLCTMSLLKKTSVSTAPTAACDTDIWKYTSLRSAYCVRWQCGTARIHPLHDAIARCWPCSNGLMYLLPTGLTAANLQQRVCSCGPSCNRQTDGWADKTEKHCTVTQTRHTMWAVDICYIALMDR